MEELEFYLEEAKDHMDKSVHHLSTALAKIRAGRAMPGMLDGLLVDYYGNPTPISQVASINTPDARTLGIKPWEKNMLPVIEKAIINSDLGLNPQPMAQVSTTIQVSQRVIMNHFTAKRMLSALSMALQRHEQAFGVLETDVRKRVQER